MTYFNDAYYQMPIQQSDEIYQYTLNLPDVVLQTPQPAELENNLQLIMGLEGLIINNSNDTQNDDDQSIFDQISQKNQYSSNLQKDFEEQYNINTQQEQIIHHDKQKQFQQIYNNDIVQNQEEQVICTQFFKDIIEKKLKGIQPSDQELQQLNDLQQEIIISIEKKKNLGIMFETQENNHKIQIQNNNKRIEEKQKFFFKKVIKYLLLKFKSNQQLQKKIAKRKDKVSLDQQFYLYYFHEVAQKHQIKIENFLHPEKLFLILQYKTLQLRQFKNNSTNYKFHQQFLIKGLRTVNQTYISLILQSYKFQRDVKEYLQTKFVEDCQKDRKQKISKLVEKLEKEKYQAQNIIICDKFEKIKQVRKKVLNYICNNPKCKLPWSNIDIRETYDFILPLLTENQQEQQQFDKI